MVASRKVDAEKAARYAIAASKGFSYHLPKSAQRHLQELVKLLPSTARPIYDEYYRDLMSAKARAPESAVALTKFVKSFPNIARQHNAFAREMNGEIDSNEHEGYRPTKFPIVAEPDTDQAETTTVANAGKKRKREPAEPASSPATVGKPQKKAKTKPSVTAATTTGPATTPPFMSDLELPATSQPNTASNDSPSDIAGSLHAVNAHSVTPDFIRSIDNPEDRIAGHEQIDWCSRSSPRILDVQSSARIGDKGDLLEESVMHPQTHQNPNLPQCNASGLPADDNEEDRGSSPTPTAPSLRHLNADTIEAANNDVSEPGPRIKFGDQIGSVVPAILPPLTSFRENTATEERKETAKDGEASVNSALSDSESGSDYALASEEEHWKFGMQALSDFDWERKGSRWLNGRGLVSIHYDDPGQSAGLFRSNHWDDTDIEDFRPGHTQAGVIEDQYAPRPCGRGS